MNEENGFYQEEAEKYFREAYESQTKGDLDQAITLYRKSIEHFPTAEAHTFLGWTYSFLNRYDEAIAECKKAIEIDPEFGNPYNDIGAYLIELGRQDEAITWLEKATKARRYDAYCYPYYNLGRIWEKKGDWQKAFRNYQDALIENREYTLAQKAVARLQGLFN